ncbi:MAG: GspH/FimT family protein [Gammaproteobacteria bacterium]
MDAGETILRKHEALTASYTIGTNTVFAKDIDFDADGAANGAGVFAVCHNGDTVGAHAVCDDPPAAAHGAGSRRRSHSEQG